MIALLLFLLLVALVALAGGQFQSAAWYDALAKPAWTPPGEVFAPVWSVLYVLIAVAGWRVWRASRGTGARKGALLLWTAQLGLNGLWSWLFFGLRRPGWALLDSVLLLVAIVGFIVVAWRASRVASLLFLPYAAWVGFATALNAAIWSLNRVR